MQKEMEQMNLKLDNMFSDILGKFGQVIIDAILEGDMTQSNLQNLLTGDARRARRRLLNHSMLRGMKTISS